MRPAAPFPRRRWRRLALAVAFLLLAGEPRAVRAQQYNLRGEPLFLGDPGTDLPKARAAVHEADSRRAEWELAALAGDYDRAGTRDPRWDDDARNGLTQYAQYLADAPTLDRLSNQPPLREGARAALGRATEAGCTDPLVAWCALALGAAPANVAPADRPRLYRAAEGALEKSAYPAPWKFRASLRAAELAGSAALRTAAATGRPAVTPPGTDMAGSCDRARTHLVELLRADSTPRDAAARAVDDFVRALHTLPDAVADRACAELARTFDAPDWLDSARDSAPRSVAAGCFWVGYAWQGNDDFHADMIRDGRWKPFAARLAKAQAALENAWRLDPTCARAAIGMMAVERGQHQSRERLETWFRRAMDADPDRFDACLEKLRYLQPRWYGDAPQAIEFGHLCQATRHWATRLPFILVEAHRQLAALTPKPSEYWRRADVWNDVRTVYADCLAAGGAGADYERSGFALLACTAGQWKLANDLFKELGDHPNLHAMAGMTPVRYQQLKARAAYLATLKPGQADALTAQDEAITASPGAPVNEE